MMHRMSRVLTVRTRPLHQNLINPHRKNVSSIQARAKSHFIYRPGSDPIRAQSVRFVRPSIFRHRRILYRRLATYAIYAFTLYTTFKYVSQYISIEVEYADPKEQGQEMEDEEEEEDESESADGIVYADEDSWFIPMTTAQKLPHEYYRASDPEWQEFVKVAKDKKRQKKIHEELVKLLQNNLSVHPTVQRFVGKKPTLGKYWLDMSFPDGPPQEYVRAGIEIGDDFVAWSSQKIDTETQNRLKRVLWPEAAFDSIWAVNSLIAGINYRRILQALGWEEKKPFDPEERYRAMKELAAKHSNAAPAKTVGGVQTDPASSLDATLRGSSSSSVSPSSSDLSTNNSSRSPWYFHVPIPGAWKADGAIAMHVFRHTISKKWSPEKREAPRGSLVLHGMVEVAGDSGTILFDVVSWYDPKTSKFLEVAAAIKNVKRKRQTPRGGL